MTFGLCMNLRQGITAGIYFYEKTTTCRDSLSKIQTQSKSHSTVDIQKQPHNVNYTILFNCRDQYLHIKQKNIFEFILLFIYRGINKTGI